VNREPSRHIQPESAASTTEIIAASHAKLMARSIAAHTHTHTIEVQLTHRTHCAAMQREDLGRRRRQRAIDATARSSLVQLPFYFGCGYCFFRLRPSLLTLTFGRHNIYDIVVLYDCTGELLRISRMVIRPSSDDIMVEHDDDYYYDSYLTNGPLVDFPVTCCGLCLSRRTEVIVHASIPRTVAPIGTERFL
jgi:hypothetical protein